MNDEAGEDERDDARGDARKAQQNRHAQTGADHGGGRQDPTRLTRRAQIERQDSAEGGGGRDAKDARIGQWIARIALQRRAAEAQRAADQDRQNRARQSQAEHDGRPRIVAAEPQGPGRPDPSGAETDGEKDDQRRDQHGADNPGGSGSHAPSFSAWRRPCASAAAASMRTGPPQYRTFSGTLT